MASALKESRMNCVSTLLPRISQSASTILCKRSFPFDLDHFCAQKQTICGIGRMCLDCNRSRLRDLGKKQRLQVLRHYGGQKPRCNCCGESHAEFLTLDHTSTNGTQHRREINGSIYRWIINNKFPSGFCILCSNCNSSLGTYGYCPHHPEITRDQARKRAKPLGNLNHQM